MSDDLPGGDYFYGLPDRCPYCDEFLVGYGFTGAMIAREAREFRPDEECNTLGEMAAWEEDCRRAAEGREPTGRGWGMGSYWFGHLHFRDEWCGGVKGL